MSSDRYILKASKDNLHETMLLLDRYRVLIIYLLLRPFLSRLEVSLQIGNNGDVTAIADEGPESGVEQNGYDQ